MPGLARAGSPYPGLAGSGFSSNPEWWGFSHHSPCKIQIVIGSKNNIILIGSHTNSIYLYIGNNQVEIQ